MKGRILVATRNSGKKREITRIMDGAGYQIVFPDDIGLDESPEEHELENTGTYEGNAWRKAEYFASRSGLPTAADDSGLEVHWLKGAPGVESRHFGGATGDENQDEINNRKLLAELDGVPEASRTARYRCVVVYVSEAGDPPRTFEGVCEGRILTSPVGDSGFGYDPLFYSDDIGKSFGVATREEKDSVSHRGRAFAEFRNWVMAGSQA